MDQTTIMNHLKNIKFGVEHEVLVTLDKNVNIGSFKDILISYIKSKPTSNVPQGICKKDTLYADSITGNIELRYMLADKYNLQKKGKNITESFKWQQRYHGNVCLTESDNNQTFDNPSWLVSQDKSVSFPDKNMSLDDFELLNNKSLLSAKELRERKQ